MSAAAAALGASLQVFLRASHAEPALIPDPRRCSPLIALVATHPLPRVRLHAKYAAAIPDCERAMKLDPTSFWNKNNLGDALLNANRPGDALSLFDACWREKPDELIPARNRGYALLALNRPEEAQRVMEGLVHAHPQDAALMVDVGRTLAAQGERKKAL